MSGLDDAVAADRRFFEALRRADREALEALLAPDFVIVDVAAGGVTERAPFIDGVVGGAVVFDRIDVGPDALVRGAGTAAVVVGRTSMQVKMPDGAEIAVESRYTHVFAPTPTGWLLQSAQGTPIG